MTCQRCGVEGETGKCPGPCARELCVRCYDADSAGYCWELTLMQRNEEIRALRDVGVSRDEVAERFGLTIRSVSRVTNG